MNSHLSLTRCATPLFVMVLAGCATGYHATGLTGGFSEFQLSPTMYEIQCQGNGYTSQERAARFLIRRAGEITLEHGYRYVLITREGHKADRLFGTFPQNKMTVRFMRDLTSEPEAADAILLVQQTDDISGGRLSDLARANMTRMLTSQ